MLTLNPPIVHNLSFDSTFDRPLAVDKVFLGEGRALTGQFGTQSVDPRLRDANAQQWNLTVQKKLPASLYFDIGCDGNRPIQVVTPGPSVPAVAARVLTKGRPGGAACRRTVYWRVFGSRHENPS